jgi:Kef-type K+ transport system membrane component KefB
LAFLILLPALLISVHVSETLGLHGLLGAVAVGLIAPSSVRAKLGGPIQPILTYLVAPFFLLGVGFFHRFALGSLELWMIAGGLALVSGGVQLALLRWLGVRWLGFEPRTAWSLGWLCTLRGLVEIVVANQLLDQGLLSPMLYQAVLLMTLLQTLLGVFAASWLLQPSVKTEARRLSPELQAT